MLSAPFLALLLLNSMFCFRLFALEAIFFASYQKISIDQSNGWETFGDILEGEIKPLLLGKYRVLIYIAPAIISIVINMITLFLTAKNLKQLLTTYPQFLLSPAFSPFMFEGVKINDSDYGVRVWRPVSYTHLTLPTNREV